MKSLFKLFAATAILLLSTGAFAMEPPIVEVETTGANVEITEEGVAVETDEADVNTNKEGVEVETDEVDVEAGEEGVDGAFE